MEVEYPDLGRARASSSSSCAARRLPADRRRLLDPPQRPAETAQRQDLLLLLVAQDVAHPGAGTRLLHLRQRLGRLRLVAGFELLLSGRFWVPPGDTIPPCPRRSSIAATSPTRRTGSPRPSYTATAARVLIGIRATTGIMHGAGVETLENALLGTVAGLRGAGGGGTFEGVALYAEWTTGPEEGPSTRGCGGARSRRAEATLRAVSAHARIPAFAFCPRGTRSPSPYASSSVSSRRPSTE